MNFIQNVCSNLLRRIHLLLLLSHRVCLRHPKTVLCLSLFSLLIGLGCASKLKMLLVIDDLIDKDFRTYSQLKSLNRNFIEKNNVYLIISTNDGPPKKAALCDLRKWIQDTVQFRGDVSRILTSFGVREVKSGHNQISLPAVLSFDCSRPDIAEDDKIRDGLQKIRSSPWGSVLTSKEADDVMVSIYLEDTLGENSRYGAFDISLVGSLMESFQKEFQSHHPEIQASWAGVGVFQYYLKIGYDQTNLLNLGTMLVLMFLFYYFFGTIKSSLLFLLTFLFALVPTYGGMALFGAPIDVLTNSLALMVLIASLEDFLFLSYVQMNGSHSGSVWRKPFRQLLVPSFFTSLSTVIGFGSLASADLEIVRRFGIWAAFASGMEFVAVFFFLPALATILPSSRLWTRKVNKVRFKFAESLKVRNIPRFLGLAALIVYGIGMAGANKLSISDAPQNIFPKDHIVRKTLDKIESSRGWQTDVSLVFADYKLKEKNQALLAEVVRDQMVKASENPYEIEEYLRRDIPVYRGDAVINMWDGSPLSRRLVNSIENSGRAVLYLGDTDIVAINNFADRVTKICNKACGLAGTLVSYGEFGERVLSTFTQSLMMSLVLVLFVLLFLVLALRQKNIFALLTSALWGPFMLLTIFVAFKIPIFYVTSIFASILIGLAGDNTIQYVFSNYRQRNQLGAEAFGGASLVLTFCMCCLSGVLFFAYFGPLKILGLLMIVGFIFSVIGDLWILKALRK